MKCCGILIPESLGRYGCPNCLGDNMAERGGKREGAGRPTASDPANKLVTVKMTERQHKRFLELGGSRWLKRLIDESMAKG